MANAFRLKPSTMFDRIDDEIKEQPLKIVFLSVEGNKTERQYFEYVEKHKKRIGIKASVHVHPLRRASKDRLCAPEDILELLEEYILIREKDSLPDLLKEVIPGEYSDEFVKQYLSGELEKSEKTRSFESLLLQAGLDLTYTQFLLDNKGSDDVFGVIIDRDYKSHSVSQMKHLVNECVKKGYHVYITNPLFEFWLLLHLVNIDTLTEEEYLKIRVNDTVSDKHTYTSKMVSDIAGHSKSISEKKFLDYYLPNIDKAINQARLLEHDVDKLIGNDSSASEKMGDIGSNIFELFDMLRE